MVLFTYLPINQRFSCSLFCFQLFGIEPFKQLRRLWSLILSELTPPRPMPLRSSSLLLLPIYESTPFGRVLTTGSPERLRTIKSTCLARPKKRDAAC